MSWAVLAILSGVVLAIVNIIDKFVVSKLVSRPLVPVMVYGITSLLSAVAVYFIYGFGHLTTVNVLWGLFAGILYSGMVLLYFYSVSQAEISGIIPVFQTYSLFVAIIAALFLGEKFTLIKYLAILMIVSGAFFINYRKNRGIRLNRSFWLMVCAAFVLAFSQVITKYLLGVSDYWTIFGYVRIGSSIAIIPVFILFGKDLLITSKKNGLAVFSLMSFTEILNLISVILLISATATGFVTLTNALSSLQSLFVLVFAVMISIFYPKILKEEIDKDTLVIKVFAIIIMIVGTSLII